MPQGKTTAQRLTWYHDSQQPDIEAHYSVQSGTGASKIPLHDHDFFEIFLVTEGTVEHVVNGRPEELKTGTLAFIRPQDTHRLANAGSGESRFINLEFQPKSLYSLFEYLGGGFDRTKLLNPPMPPEVMLGQLDAKRLINNLDSLNSIAPSKADAMRFALRCLLFEICTYYLRPAMEETTEGIPQWLDRLCREMHRPENFLLGLSRMRELACRSSEHLCREFRRHLGRTPSDFINEVRLNYAANLLAHTDRPITRIAFDTGYDNLSYFYKLFSAAFGMPPSKWRAAHNPYSGRIR